MGRIAETKRQQFDALMRDFADRLWPLMADSHEKGMRWQDDFKLLAEGRNLAWEPGSGRGDCKVNGLTVQCKAIDEVRCGNTLNVGNMRPVKANKGHRGYLAGEYDVLALRHSGAVYLVPSRHLEKQNGTLRNRVNVCELEEWREAWCVFDNDYMPPRRSSQLALRLDEEATDGTHSG